MDPLLLLIVIVGGVTGAVFLILERRTWQEFHVSRGHDATAAQLHHALRAAGVRCRYRVGNSGALFSQLGGAMSRIQETRVLVHRNDLHRAHEVRAAVRANNR